MKKFEKKILSIKHKLIAKNYKFDKKVIELFLKEREHGHARVVEMNSRLVPLELPFDEILIFGRGILLSSLGPDQTLVDKL